MEHEGLKRVLSEFRLPESERSRAFAVLTAYAESLYSENSRFNLTGHKCIHDIIENLIIGSLEPFSAANVPRGTSFIDIGCGAGIPGVPLAAVFRESRWLLIDSNLKKTEYIKNITRELDLPVETLAARAEEAAFIPLLDSSFDFALSRAVANPCIMAELSCRFLKNGGYVYLYSSDDIISQPADALDHIKKTGLSPAAIQERTSFGIKGGILLKKVLETPEAYPRRYAVIKRGSERIYDSKNTSNEVIQKLR